MWEYCGMARNEQGLKTALEKIPALRAEYWRDVNVLGTGEELNQSLEKAGRVADFLELGELMCRDALERARVLRRPLPRGVPDPGGRGAARRRATSPTSRPGSTRATTRRPVRHQEPLTFEYVHLTQRSYK